MNILMGLLGIVFLFTAGVELANPQFNSGDYGDASFGTVSLIIGILFCGLAIFAKVRDRGETTSSE